MKLAISTTEYDTNCNYHEQDHIALDTTHFRIYPVYEFELGEIEANIIGRVLQVPDARSYLVLTFELLPHINLHVAAKLARLLNSTVLAKLEDGPYHPIKV
jgi:hypothetical protein